MLISLDKEIIRREPLKLLKNKRFPTYQLYAEVDNDKIDVLIAFKMAVLETMSWIRRRFRELEIPDELDFPEPEDYQLVDIKDFKSFRINRGYIVEVVYINDNESIIWSFHLMEPDLGLEPGNSIQGRQPVAGRVFETNIAFTIHRGKLECGFKTICSEPEGINIPCEVFRMEVVKNIVRNKHLGLKQIYTIIEEAYIIDTLDKARRLKGFINNKDRQLPIIIIAEYEEKPNLPLINTEKPYYSNRNSLPAELLLDNIEINKDNIKLPINVDKISKGQMAYAQFFIIRLGRVEDYNRLNSEYNIAQGDIRIIHPLKFAEESNIFKLQEIQKNRRFEDNLAHSIQEYPKYKSIDYKNIRFLNEARLEEQQRIINMADSKETISNAYEIAIEELVEIYEGQLDSLHNKIENKDDIISKLKCKIKYLETEIASRDKYWIEKNKESEKYLLQEIADLHKQNKRKDLLLDRPKRTEDIPGWVEKQFGGRLIFHSKAIDLIRKVRTDEIDMDLLCDAIEFLAHEYRDERMGLISEENKYKGCKEKYNRPFTVTPSGKKSIEYYASDYKIKYKENPNGKLGEVILDLHLKVGVGKENLLRIYFYYDRDKDLVVVGSLPYHLKSVYKVK